MSGLLTSRACPAQIHLQPTAPLAERVLLPGDPGRALLLAQALLAGAEDVQPQPRPVGLYRPGAPDGQPLTIQSTGMGGPSAAIVIAELADLGVRTLMRVGTCGGLDGSLMLGELLVASEALCADGTSRALRRRSPGRSADPDLLARLREAGPDARRRRRVHRPVLRHGARHGRALAR